MAYRQYILYLFFCCNQLAFCQAWSSNEFINMLCITDCTVTISRVISAVRCLCWMIHKLVANTKAKADDRRAINLVFIKTCGRGWLQFPASSNQINVIWLGSGALERRGERDEASRWIAGATAKRCKSGCHRKRWRWSRDFAIKIDWSAERRLICRCIPLQSSVRHVWLTAAVLQVHHTQHQSQGEVWGFQPPFVSTAWKDSL